MIEAGGSASTPDGSGLPAPILRPGWWDAAVVVLALLVSGGGSLWLGQDLNFDLLSYHYYNGYALLDSRLDRDLAPVGWHTYINPTLDALFYAGMAKLPARAFGFALGALQGVNLALVYFLCLALLVPLGLRSARPLALLAAALTALGPAARSLLGTTMGNNLVSLPVLGALLVLLWPMPARTTDGGWPGWSAARLFSVAALCGAATGLRLTAAGEHLALVAVAFAFAVRGRPLAVALRAGVWLALGSVVGFGVTAGHWCVQMALRFGNPLFPFANQLFRSPWFEEHFFRDERWAAHGLLDVVRPAFDLALGHTHRLLEIGVRDARFLFLFTAVAAALFVTFGPRRRPDVGFRRLSRPEAFVVAFWFAAYALWVTAFYYYRYMTTLELLAPLALLVALRGLVVPRLLLPVAAAIFLALGLYARSDSWGRGDWQENWFGVELPARARRAGSLVLIAGAPVSFALPYFAGDARFAHLTAMREKGGTALFARELQRRIDAHPGPLLLLAPFRVDSRAQDAATRRPRWTYNPEEDVTPAATEFGLRLTERCDDIRTRRLRLYMCDVERAPPVRP
jgi:hypothetical protein